MARRTKEEALVTRDQILDAAERVFQRRGVSRTSLQEIAQDAGLTRGAIYWHFQNKADVFDAMMQRVTLPMVANLNSQPEAEAADPLLHLRRNVATAFHQTVHDQQVRRVFEIASHKVEYVDELQALRERHIAERDQCLSDLHRLLALALQRKLLAPGTPVHAVTIGLHALIDGLMHNWLLNPQSFDLEAVGERALDAYLAGLAPR
ncbi:MAG: TetR family transcriptional regulator [Pseudomonadota bacterium]